MDPARPPGLYLHGDFKAGKTWLGVYFAMQALSHLPADQQAGALRYWSERRYIDDLEKKRWYDKIVAADPRNIEAWTEANTFEREFVKLQMATILVLDNLFYSSLQDYRQAELDWLLKERLDHGLTTVICAARLPAPATQLRRLVQEHAVVVQLNPLYPEGVTDGAR